VSRSAQLVYDDRMPAVLSPAEIEQFERDGYVAVREAFARADAEAMEAAWWAELETVHGVRRDDYSTWKRIDSDLKAAKRDPLQQRVLSHRLRGALDDLLGAGEWLEPNDWGRTIATFPQAGEWDVPSWFWHWDNAVELHLDQPGALLVVSFVGSVAARSGGTQILAGSPRLLIKQQRRGALPDAKPWFTFYRSHPWLAALAGEAPTPADRVTAFMHEETVIEGVPLRVVELTGNPGDMVLCHPCMVHTGAPNTGAYPRFMRIRQQLWTRRGRAKSAALHQ
jgi:hypothetical protein